MERVEEEQWMVCQLCNMMSRRGSRQWLRACQCPQPFHRQCLQYRVWVCEAQHPPKAPSCPWCRVLYSVKPSKSIVIKALDKIAHSWYPNICQAVALFTCQVLVDSVSTTFGFLILSRVYGFQEASVLLMDMDPFTVVTICHCIPLIAIVINFVPWEEYCLRSLKRLSGLPVLGAILPQGSFELEPLRHHSTSTIGNILGGLLLPVFADITGRFLFQTEKSPAIRFFLGGAVFIVVRGILYMYYRQQTFIHQKNLAVANYVPQN